MSLIPKEEIMDMDDDVKMPPEELLPSENTEPMSSENNQSGSENAMPPSVRRSVNREIKQQPPDEAMEQDLPVVAADTAAPEEPIRPLTPPPRQRSRSRSRTRERSAEIQQSLIAARETEPKIRHIVKSDSDEFKHNIYYGSELGPKDLSKSAIQRTVKIFGYPKYALIAFECGHHVFYSSDNPDERKIISDYARRKTLAEFESGSRVFVIVRNEAVQRRRFKEIHAVRADATFIPEGQDLQLLPGLLASHMCVIMTIETFRTAALRIPGDSFQNDTFIFEDFQYIGDPVIGNLYEEALLVPPINGQFVFLTPLIDNAGELARWICSLDDHHRPIHSIKVMKRKTPLNHFVARQYGALFGRVVGEEGNFQQDQFRKATTLPKAADPSKSNDKKEILDRQSQIEKAVRTVMFRQQDKILIYSSDTEDVERTAQLLSKMSFPSERDQKMIATMFDRGLEQLSDEDMKLPDIVNLKPFLVRGIATYHQGMLPILRQIIESLYVKGFITVIVADRAILMETNFVFKSAIIIRDRTMVEPGLYQWIKPTEYKEICDRVHGKVTDDNVQTSLVMLIIGEEDMPVDVATQIYTNNIPTLESQLRITPSLILTAIESPVLNDQQIIPKSLLRFQKIEKASRVQSEVREKSAQLFNYAVDSAEIFSECEDLKIRIEDLKEELRKKKFIPNKILPFMDVGRIVKVCMNKLDFGYSVVLRPLKNKEAVYVILNISKESFETNNQSYFRPAQKDYKDQILVVPVNLIDITVVTTERLSIPKKLYDEKEINIVKAHLDKLIENLRGDVRELEVAHLKIDDAGLKAKERQAEKLKKELVEKQQQMLNYDEKYERFLSKEKLNKEVDDLEELLEGIDCVSEERMLRHTLELLGPRNYYDDVRENLFPKAKFALELHVKENILLTELFCESYFNYLIGKESILILSTFIEMETRSDDTENNLIHPDNRKLFQEFKDKYVQKFGTALRKSNILTPAEVVPWIKSFSPTMFPFYDSWCRSMPFNSSQKQANLRSGSVALYAQRLHKLLLQMKTMSEFVPAPPPEEGKPWRKQFEEWDSLVARGVPFSSL